MSDPNGGAESAVHDHLAAFNTGGLERLAEGLDRDAVFATGQDVIRGKDQIIEFLGDSIRAVGPQLLVRSMISRDHEVACEMLERVVVDGETQEYALAAFYRIQDGRIRSAKIYREGTAEI